MDQKKLLKAARVKLLTKLYFYFTAYFPRLLPRTEDEYYKFQFILKTYFNVEDSPRSWTTVASHVASVPTGKLRKSYGFFANNAKRLRINEIAYAQKQIAGKQLEALLKEKVEQYLKDNPEKTPEETTPSQMN